MIRLQAFACAAFALAGFACAFLYDLLRPLRRGRARVLLCDALYFVLCALVCAVTVIYLDMGALRAYAPLSCALGTLVYRMGPHALGAWLLQIIHKRREGKADARGE